MVRVDGIGEYGHGCKSSEETGMVSMMIWVSWVVRESEKNRLMTLFMGSMDGRDII